MTDIIKLLKKARTIKDRAELLKKELSKRKKDVEKFNGGLVLDIDEYEGLMIGDKLKYVDALGKTAEGYISHFFVYEKNDQRIIPVIVPIDNSGYSTHCGHGLPQKLLE